MGKETVKSAEDLISLFHEAPARIEHFLSNSNAMRDYKEDICLHGFQKESSEFNNSVFPIWLEKAVEVFFSNSFMQSEYEASKLFVDRIRSDTNWWIEENRLKDGVNQQIRFSDLFRESIYRGDFKNQQDLYEEWCNIWLDSGWLKDSRDMLECLTRSVFEGNKNTVTRLIKEYKLDINSDITLDDISTVKGSLFENIYHDFIGEPIKLGYFVKSWAMADTLSRLGFNWDVDVSKNTHLLTVIQNKNDKEFESPEARLEIIRVIVKSSLGESGYTLSKLENAIFNSKNEGEIEVVLSSINRTSFRGEDGQNVMHLLARYAPKFFKGHLSTKENGVPLMGITDNNKVYPLEYFLCFADTKTVSKELSHILDIVKKNNLPNPDWLATKLLVAKNKATYSGVDSAPLSIWKQKTPDDFKKILKTNHGMELLDIVANHFKYQPVIDGLLRDSLCAPHYYGMDINKYTNSKEEEYSFFKSATNKNEVKIALAQSLGLFYTPRFQTNEMRDIISYLINMAIDLDIGADEIKEDMLESSSSSRTLVDKLFSSCFEKWDNLAIIVERKRLLSRVSRQNMVSNNDKKAATNSL